MTTPTITLYPDTLPAKGQANDAFDVNVNSFLNWLTLTNGPELQGLVTYTNDVANTVLATALAGDLPALTGKAGEYIRANAAEDGGEFRTPSQVKADIGLGGITDNSSSTAVTINSSGFVGINVTNPNKPLQVKGGDNASGTAFRITSNNESANLGITYDSILSDTILRFFTGSYDIGTGVERMRIDASGGLILAGSTAQKSTGTAWSNPSDIRLKSNVRDYKKGCYDLMKLRVCEWHWNGRGGTEKGTNGIGVIADEIMIILPNSVETYETLLDEGDLSLTEVKKFDATEVTWLLVTSLQEALTKIDSLTARIAALEGGA
jgi:hypothetical protein